MSSDMEFRAFSLLTGILLVAGVYFASCRAAPTPVEAALEPDRPQASLPPPDRKPLAAPPPQEPVPPAVGRAEAVRQVSRVMPRGLRLLRTAAGVPLTLHDLDADGRPECIALAVASRELSEEQFWQLGNPARLFEGEAQRIGFHLVLFSNRDGAFEPLQALPLGEHQVFETLRAIPLSRSREMPLIVTVDFLTPEGRRRELLVFGDGSGVPSYRRSLTETLSTHAHLEDIDGDGNLDLVLLERAMEEGTGYETFLTWYRWDGRGFRQFRTRNVVRSLNVFLAGLRGLLLQKRVSEFLTQALEPRQLERLRRQGLGSEAIVLRTLGLEPAELPGLPEIREIVLPRILENPFAWTDSVGSFFELSFRIIAADGNSYIAVTRVYMLRNPFAERQFALVPPLD